ncbi:MAG: hypothetical protein MUC60_06945 [Oscillatoria sp. Prado101]|nr:hypothetical protein [Oscillatoria sp. Prado101]
MYRFPSILGSHLGADTAGRYPHFREVRRRCAGVLVTLARKARGGGARVYSSPDLCQDYLERTRLRKTEVPQNR